MYFEQKVSSMAWTSCWAMGATIIKLGILGPQRIGTSALSWLQHYLEQHPHDFSLLVDQVWIYNLWFTIIFLGQIWWKKELWVLFSNAKPKTCNLDIWYDMIYIISYHMGTSCPGYELSWVRVVLGTSCPGYELSWVRVVLGTSCLGYELSWVRVVLGTSCLGYELSRSPGWVGRAPRTPKRDRKHNALACTRLGVKHSSHTGNRTRVNHAWLYNPPIHQFYTGCRYQQGPVQISEKTSFRKIS